MIRRLISERLQRWIHGGIGLGRIKGIPVRVHLALIPLIAYWLVYDLTGENTLNALVWRTINLSILFGSILLHELGHCYGAHLVGEKSEGILLWPLGGLAFVTGTTRSPYDEFIIVLLGPAVNVVLALAASVALWILPQWVTQTSSGAVLSLFLKNVQMINAINFVFNMSLPLFPMDCARLVRSLLSMKYDPQRVTYNVCLGGFFVAGVVSCLYVVGSLTPLPYLGVSNSILLLLIAAFGIFHCIQELHALEFSYVYSEPWRSNAPFRALLRRMRMTIAPQQNSAPKPPLQTRQPDPDPPDDSMPASERAALELELRAAVEREDFIRAAELRDRLRELHAETQKG